MKSKAQSGHIKTESEHITPKDGNVFLDLGFTPEEAARFYIDSQKKNQAEIMKLANQSLNSK